MNCYDLSIRKGETFTLSFNLADDNGNALDLTGYTISGSLKNSFGDTGLLSNLGLQVVAPQSGAITLNIPFTETKNFPVTVAMYDIFMLNSSVSFRIMGGKAYIHPETIF